MDEYGGISKYTKRPRTEKIKSYGIKGIPLNLFSNSHSKNYNWKISILAKNIGGVANKGRSGKFVDYIRREAESLINVGDIDAKRRFNELDDKLLSRRKNSVIQRRLIIPVPSEFLKNKDKLMEKFGQQMQDKYFGACYTWTASLHAGGKDFKNPHIHIIYSNCDNNLRNIREFHDKDFLDSFKKDVGIFINRELGIKCEVGLPKTKKEFGIKGGKHYPQWVIGTFKKYENNPEKLKEYCDKYSILQDYMDYLKDKEQIKNIVELEKKEQGIKQRFSGFVKENQKTFEKITGKEEVEIKNKVAKIKQEVKEAMDLKILKDIDVVELAERLGFEQDKTDKKAYRRGNVKVSIDPATGRFNSFNFPGVKGRGAIDFVMTTENKDFKGAIQFLSGEYAGYNYKVEKSFSFQPEIKKPEQEKKILEMPPRSKNEDVLKKGINYLLEERKIGGKIVNELTKEKKIYVDNNSNIVFACKDIDGNNTGAEIKNVNFKGMAKGTDRNKGAFYIYQTEPKTLILTESAIDAISYKNLKNPANSIIASTGGVMPHTNQFIDDVVVKYGCKEVKIGYDNDEAGQKAALNLKADIESKYPELKVEIERSKGKDWNEDLKLLLEKEKLLNLSLKSENTDDAFAEDLKRRQAVKKENKFTR